MKKTGNKFLILFCFAFSFTANANKLCVECGKIKTSNKENIHKNELEGRVSQIIEAEFKANEVEFDIPKTMIQEFEIKKQNIINNLRKKMHTLNVDYILINDITSAVKQSFNLFIKRVEIIHLAAWVHEILSNMKDNNKKHTKNSCLNINKSSNAKTKVFSYLTKNAKKTEF